MCKNRNNNGYCDQKNAIFADCFKTPENERIIHHFAADCLQRFHDVRMVRSAQTSGSSAQFQGLATDSHHPAFVGRGPHRIFLHDSCQSHRSGGQRRPLQPNPAESHTRSHFPHRFHGHRHHRFQDRNLPMEPHRCVPFHRRCGLFRVQKVDFCCDNQKIA